MVPRWCWWQVLIPATTWRPVGGGEWDPRVVAVRRGTVEAGGGLAVACGTGVGQVTRTGYGSVAQCTVVHPVADPSTYV